MEIGKSIEIPFGAKDSELKGWEYTIPEGYEARIDGNKVIIEPKESEDERIRKVLIRGIESVCKEEEVFTEGFTRKQIVAWLEKQGSQNLANSAKTCNVEWNPAWSEEDENMLACCEIAIDFFKNLGKNSSGHPHPNYFDLDKKIYPERVIDWLKSLKERYTWKPSDEQMRVLEDVKMRMSLDGYGLCPILQTLINDLKNLKG